MSLRIDIHLEISDDVFSLFPETLAEKLEHVCVCHVCIYVSYIHMYMYIP